MTNIIILFDMKKQAPVGIPGITFSISDENQVVIIPQNLKNVILD